MKTNGSIVNATKRMLIFAAVCGSALVAGCADGGLGLYRGERAFGTAGACLSWMATQGRVIPAAYSGRDLPFGQVLSGDRGWQAVDKEMRAHGHDLARHRNDGKPVPRTYLATLPSDLGAANPVGKRKVTFISVVLPLILRVNEEIMQDRRLVATALACRALNVPFGHALGARIEALHGRYATGGDYDVLRYRMDVVPPSLAIAQAAIESGWGTSRFAIHGNSLFGQRTTNAEKGMRPTDLPRRTDVRVRAFGDLLDSVRAYVHNLNTHAPYRDFRGRRAALRRFGREMYGPALAEALSPYSTGRADYVGQVQAVIRGNRLFDFDNAQLSSDSATTAPRAGI